MSFQRCKYIFLIFICILPVISSAQSTGQTFTVNLKVGDEHPQVQTLQQFLNQAGYTVATQGAGSPGNTTTYYGPRTALAVSQLQQQYAAEILAPVDLVRPSGYFGPSTRAKANALLQANAGAQFTPSAVARSRADLVALIQQLQAQIAELQKQLDARRGVADEQEDALNDIDEENIPLEEDTSEEESELVDEEGLPEEENEILEEESLPEEDITEEAVEDENTTSKEVADTPTDPGEQLTTQTISQHGITWTFAESVRYGTYANGDYWVQGPVTITSITPDFDGRSHGWEVNPTPQYRHGFDARVGGFSASLVPTLPYRAVPDSSILKSVSVSANDTGCRPCLKTAAVLTIVDDIPTDNGATVFRPPYVGSTKTIYSTEQIDYDVLPRLDSVRNQKSLDWTTRRFERVQLDHKPDWLGRAVHPVDNMPDYGASIARDTADGVLSVMFADSDTEKRDALVAYLQMGIDWYGILDNGGKWGPNGGHSNGRKLPIAFAGVVLNDSDMKSAIANAPESSFSENAQVFSTGNAAVALWGSHTGNRWGETRYWQKWRENKGARTVGDWYGYIDGGEKPGGVYQGCCTSQPFKATAIAVHLLPGLRAVWNDDEFLDYADRWVYFGAWTQPDPCAPYDGNARNYGVTYGPDGSGGCIKDTDPSDGIGRFPDLHGTNADGGGYGSSFANAMWEEYRGNLDASELPFPPGKPQKVRSSGNEVEEITITWEDLNTETAYRVERKQGAGDWQSVASLSQNSTSFTDDGLQSNTEYQYRVIASNNTGDSLPSDVETVYTLQAISESEIESTSALVARYTFDGNVRDQSGNGFDGSVRGDPSYVAGKYGSALEFDGSGDYVYIGRTPEAFNFTEEFSFAVWVRPTATGGFVFGKGALSGGLVGQYAFSGNAVRIADTSGKQLRANAGLVTGEWQHIAATFDGTTLRTYRNGELQSEDSRNDLGPLGHRYTNNVHIGAERSVRTFYNGQLDDLQIYNQALTSSEVSTIYNAGDTPAGDVLGASTSQEEMLQKLSNLRAQIRELQAIVDKIKLTP